MRKCLAALILSGLFLLAAGCGQQPPKNEPHAEDPAAETGPSGEGSAENAKALYDFGTVQLALPLSALEQLIVETGDASCEEDLPLYPRSLMMVYEKASVEAAEADYGNADGFGFLWGFCELDQAAFEQLLCADGSGISVFARSGELYYAFLYPTDVQFYRSGDFFEVSEEEWKNWESLNELGAQVSDDFTARNELTSYTTQEILNQPFLYQGQHAYVKYYHYYTFDGSQSQFQTLVLSQPVKQGEGGLWCVEQFYDEFGTVYLHIPDSGTSAAEYYTALQGECDAGQYPELLTPLGAARAFVSDSAWFSDTVSDNNVVLTDGIDSGYFDANRRMMDTVATLLTRPEAVSETELLTSISSFRSDTWGVMGRHFYGSDWWPPLQTALENAAVGDGQAERDRSMMAFYLTSYGQYADFIGGLLRTQHSTAPEVFQTTLEFFSPEQQTRLLTAAK